MKKLSIILIVAMLAGCQWGNIIYPAPVTSVCTQPEAQGSVICQIATYLKTTPEQLNDALLDASLVGIWTKLISATDLRAAVSKVRQYTAMTDNLTMDMLIRYITKESETDPALALLLSRRLKTLNVTQGALNLKIFKPFDKGLVVKALDSQTEQLTWF